MHWLFPGFLAGTAALALPVLLHLLRRRPKQTIFFPSLRFLGGTRQQNEKSQRLRRWLVLLLRCAVLALLAGVFARPFFGTDIGGSRQAVVIVIDNSFSLQAGRRWEVLRQWARQQVGETTPADRVGLLLMGPRPTWLAPANTPADAALAMLQALSPGWEATSAEPALRLAADALSAMPADRKRIILLSDHQRTVWSGFNFGKKLPPGIRALFPGLPEAMARQAAVRAPVVTRAANGFHASVPIQNFTSAQNRTLRVYRDTKATPVLQQSIALAERSTQTLQLDWPADNATVPSYFRFALDEDDLPADDQSFAVWQPEGDRSVLLDSLPAGSTADYVAAALTSTATIQPSFQVIPASTAVWPPHAVAVLRNDASFAGEAAVKLDMFLHSGGSALIFVGGGAVQTAWLANSAGLKVRALNADSESLQVRDWAMDNTLVTGLAAHSVRALLGWNFRRGWALPADAVDALALWPQGGAAIAETSGRAGRMLLCGFTADRRDSEWPAREMFVPFVHRSVAYLFGTQAEGAVRPTRVSEPITLPLESGSWRAVAGPAAGGAATEVSSNVTPAMPGVYEFQSGSVKKLFAVNVTPEESDPAPWSDGTPWQALNSNAPAPVSIASRLPVASLEAEQRAPLWWWLIAAMAVLLLAELGLANRTAR
jgi:hypothetical protein